MPYCFCLIFMERGSFESSICNPVLNMGLTTLVKTWTAQNSKAKLSIEVVQYHYLTSSLSRVPHPHC